MEEVVGLEGVTVSQDIDIVDDHDQEWIEDRSKPEIEFNDEQQESYEKDLTNLRVLEWLNEITSDPNKTSVTIQDVDRESMKYMKTERYDPSWAAQERQLLTKLRDQGNLPEKFLPKKDHNGTCPECNKKVTSRSRGVECECCLNLYHVKCGDISSNDEYRNINATVWYCRKCITIREKNKSVQQAKLFLRYVDDIVRTAKGDPEKVLLAANLLHPNLQFTIKKPNTKKKLAFLILQISIDKSRKMNCGWHQKPTDTGTILNFRSIAPFSTREV